MFKKYEIREIKGNGAYCPLCRTEKLKELGRDRLDYYEAKNYAGIPRGFKALRIYYDYNKGISICKKTCSSNGGRNNC